MAIPRYDEKELTARLRALPNRLRVAFAAACAERQLPNYLKFYHATGQGDQTVLTEALGYVWNDIEQRSTSNRGFPERLEACMDLLPKGDQESLDDQGFADDAVMAVAYAIRARLTSDAREAVYAADVAHSALDEHVSDALGVQTIGPSEENTASHPIVQAEFKRELDDLSELERLAKNPAGEKQRIADLRRRAQFDAKHFFEP
jgi:uncharacterized protein YjaG (DUF416 family)